MTILARPADNQLSEDAGPPRRSTISLLLADVDGTLVTNDKVLTEAASSAVRELSRVGIAFGITSSRPPRGLRMLIEPLALKVPLAGLNGGLIVNPDLSVIECRKLAPATAKQIVALLLGERLDVWIYTENDWLVRDPAGPHVAREAWILKFDPIVVADFTEAHLAHAVKIVGVSDDLERVAACEGLARAALGDVASAARSNPYFLDVTHPGANKGAVVLALGRILGIAPSRIATIGDMPNDVPMFDQSGVSIAMGNASDAVKAKADHVTASNEDDGFAAAVRGFILPPAPHRAATASGEAAV